MDYYELYFRTQTAADYQQDLLINALGEIGFDTFEEFDDGFKAYIPAAAFSLEQLDEQISTYREMFLFSYEMSFVPQKNWNELWESNFEPISIKDLIFVRATFHEPATGFPLPGVIIDPKMAFGTGHHQTTSMMLELLLETGGSTGKKGCWIWVAGQVFWRSWRRNLEPAE